MRCDVTDESQAHDLLRRADEEAIEGLDALRERLDAMHAEDIANAIVYATTQPERVSVNEILIRPTQQP